MGIHTNQAALKLGQAPVDRRERRPVSLRGYAVRDDQSRVEVLLLDLSYDGCGIQTAAELETGEKIRVAVLGRGQIAATVRWFRGGKAGLVFDAEEPETKRQSPRRCERKPLTAEISLRRLGKINYRVQVFDISCDGCRVDVVDVPRIGEHMLVKLDGLESLDCEVCWIEDHYAGLRFEKPIHPAVFDLLIERLSRSQ